MTGRLFSLIAIPLSLLGHLLYWTGGSALLLIGLLLVIAGLAMRVRARRAV